MRIRERARYPPNTFGWLIVPYARRKRPQTSCTTTDVPDSKTGCAEIPASVKALTDCKNICSMPRREGIKILMATHHTSVLEERGPNKIIEKTSNPSK